jgi:hypothetical protein
MEIPKGSRYLFISDRETEADAETPEAVSFWGSGSRSPRKYAASAFTMFHNYSSKFGTFLLNRSYSFQFFLKFCSQY